MSVTNKIMLIAVIMFFAGGLAARTGAERGEWYWAFVGGLLIGAALVLTVVEVIESRRGRP